MITIVLLAFLVLLLVSLATITRVETQVASNTQRTVQARANAMLALNMALGELQRAAGPDRRVTAPSNIGTSAAGKSDEQPFLTGVWRHEPGTASDLPSLARSPTLVSWLVSGNENMEEGDPVVTPTDLASLPLPEADPDVVWLLGENSVEFSGSPSAANPDLRVRLRKRPIQAGPGLVPGLDTSETPTVGHYAWWVGDEGVKARVNLRDPYYTSTNADELKARLASAQRVPGRLLGGLGAGGGSTGFPDDSSFMSRVMDQSQLRLLAPDVEEQQLRRNYHNLSAVSAGLLTDTRNGGLRQDLSFLASRTDLTGFRAALGTAFEDIDASFTPSASRNMIVEPGVSVPDWMPPYFAVGGDTVGPTWEQLYSFMRLPQEVDASGAIAPRPQTATNHGVGPVLVQVKLGFGLRAVPVDESVPEENREYYIDLHYFPLIVLGNPHSVDLAPASYRVHIRTGGNTYVRVGTEGGYVDKAAHRINGFVNQSFHLEAKHPIPAGGASVFSLEFADTEFPNTGWDAGSLSYALDQRDSIRRIYKMVDDFSADVSLRYRAGDIKKRKGDYGERATSYAPDPYKFTAEEKDQATLLLGKQFDGGDSDSAGIGVFLWTGESGTTGNGGSNETIYQIMSRETATKTMGQVTGSLGGGVDTYPGGALIQRHLDANDGPGSAYIGEINMRAPELDPTMSADDGSIRYPLFASGNSLIRSSRQYFDGVDSGLRIGPDNRSVSWMLSYRTSGNAVSAAPLFHVPRSQVNSLAQLQHFNATGYLSGAASADGGFSGAFTPLTATWVGSLTPTQGLAYQPPYTIGRSKASMFLARDALYSDSVPGKTGNGNFHRDNSYLLNTALWDRFYFSTIAYGGGGVDFGGEDVAAINRRYSPRSGESQIVPAAQINAATAAERLQVLGAFNVNSTSIDAWTAFLGGVLGVSFNGDVGADEAAFPRHLDMGGTSANAADGVSANAWRGFRKLDRMELRTLAEKIVDQVKLRGPFLSLSDFVNRRLISASTDIDLIGVRGALAAAIDEAGLNSIPPAPFGDAPDSSLTGNVADVAHRQKHLVEDFPGWLTEADVLQPLAPYLTARSDTFTIRAYGDVINPVTSALEGRAWCEAVVQRNMDFVADEQSASTRVSDLNSTNSMFGRRYQVVSFRWLGPQDI